MSELDLFIFVFIMVLFLISFLIGIKTIIDLPEFFITITIKKKEEK